MSKGSPFLGSKVSTAHLQLNGSSFFLRFSWNTETSSEPIRSQKDSKNSAGNPSMPEMIFLCQGSLAWWRVPQESGFSRLCLCSGVKVEIPSNKWGTPFKSTSIVLYRFEKKIIFPLDSFRVSDETVVRVFLDGNLRVKNLRLKMEEKPGWCVQKVEMFKVQSC